MSKLITDEQKHEIEKLAVEHFDALIAYGGDMYRSGMIRGAIAAITGIAAGVSISYALSKIKLNKHSHLEDESN